LALNIKSELKNKVKICFIATVPYAVHAFLRAHINFLSRRYDVTVICNKENIKILRGISAKFIFLDIKREPSVLKDIHLLIQLITIFRKHKFNIVHSIMPKTGFVGMFAAFLSGIKIRIHTFTGQVWVTKKGFMRLFLKFTDFLTATFATYLLADSFGQRKFLINNKIVPPIKIDVLGHGSIAGVDLNRFFKDISQRKLIRKKLKIKANDVVFIFIGRLNIDKGILDLIDAFEKLSSQYPKVHLFLVGSIEKPLLEALKKKIQNPNIHYFSYSLFPEKYLSASDIFCLPSYREGFPNVIIEAASIGIPAIASNIYGVNDAVLNNKTGLLHNSGDIDATERCMRLLAKNKKSREKLGREAKARVFEYFDQKILLHELSVFYQNEMQRLN